MLLTSRSSRKDWTTIPQGDRGLLLVFGDDIDVTIGRRCAAAAKTLRTAGLSGVTDIVPSFNSVAVLFQPALGRDRAGFQTLAEQIEEVLTAKLDREDEEAVGKTIEIPVCYGGEYGPDLGDVARHCGLTEDEVVALHSGVPAYVFMLGFAPGAPYIGVHDPRLAIGRRATPRTHLPAGSVAIANRQTIIYPNASPGGWHIIGATPAVLFDPTKDQPALFSPGDSVRFNPVSQDEFRLLKQGPA